MRSSRRLLSSVAVLTVALGVAAGVSQHLDWPAASPEEAGSPAPLRADWAGPWEVAGRIPADRLGRGEIVDLHARGDTLYLLQRQQWYRLGPDGQLAGPFGTASPGAPGRIAHGLAIQRTATGVYVLDASLREVSRWSPEGARLEALAVGPHEDRASFRPEEMVVDAAGAVVVSGRVTVRDPRGGGSGWAVVRLEPGSPAPVPILVDTTLAPSSAHRRPHLTALPGGGVLVANALTYELRRYDEAGRFTGSVRRPDPPVHPVSQTVRADYLKHVARLPSAARRGMELPEHYPPVRRVAARADGRTVVLLAAGVESFGAEVVDAAGVPLGRLWRDAVDGPVFAAPDALYRVRHEMNGAVLERQRITLP